MSNNKIKDFWWPDMVDETSARKAAMGGAAAAIICCVVTAVVAIGGFMGSGPKALIDAALFGGVALGLKMMSRACAIGGLILYLLERGYTLSQGGGVGNPFMAIFLTMMFINAIRGTLYFHRLGTGSTPGTPAPRTGPPLPNGLYIPPKINA